jgi:hypothetical protein
MNTVFNFFFRKSGKFVQFQFFIIILIFQVCLSVCPTLLLFMAQSQSIVYCVGYFQNGLKPFSCYVKISYLHSITFVA